MGVERVSQETPRGIIGPDQWEIDYLANLPPSTTKRQGLFSPKIAAASRIILGGLGFIVAGGATACYTAPQPVVEARAIQPSTEVPPTRTLTPIPPATETPTSTVTATSSATPSATASETPSPTYTPTKEPTKTPTPEATPTPKPPEKSPLPKNAVFTVTLLNEKTRVQEGMAVIASKSQTEDPDEIFAFTMENNGDYNAFFANVQHVENNSFEATNPVITRGRTARAGAFTVKGSFDKSTGILSGRIETKRISYGETKIKVLNFKGNIGTSTVEEAAKKMKQTQLKLGGNWNTVNINELKEEFDIDLSKLP